MKLLVGLGNPGEEYRATRHNVGYRVAEAFRRRHGGGREERRARSLVSRCDLGEGEILVARPLTYMNRSGEAVAALLDLVQAGPGDTVLVMQEGNGVRQILKEQKLPIRSIIVGIVDQVHAE